MNNFIKSNGGFTFVEIVVVLVLITLGFMVFLQALNTGKSVRVNSEIRVKQALLLNDLQNQIRARRFDENLSSPWSAVIGTDTGESSISDFDDIDDFNNYNITVLEGYPGHSLSVEVSYVSLSNKFHTAQNYQTEYKRVMVKISHLTLPSIIDTMIISSGL